MLCTTYKKYSILGIYPINGIPMICLKSKTSKNPEFMAVTEVDYFDGVQRHKLKAYRPSNVSSVLKN